MHKINHLSMYLVIGLMTYAFAEEPSVKDGDKIAFLGDSITDQGAAKPGGYVRLVVSGLGALGIKVEVITAGRFGDKSDQMLDRLQRDVLSKKPTWMTLSCGVNDVWHGSKGIPLDQYKINITAIVDRCQLANVKVMILTSTMITEDSACENNRILQKYNGFLRALSVEKKCLLADLNSDMQAALALAKINQRKPANGNYLTVDGVHMNTVGNRMMATGVLKGFGFLVDNLAKVCELWMDIPGTCELFPNIKLSQRQFQKLSAIAGRNGCSEEALVDKAVTEKMDALFKQ